jgi:hypothetical protein
MNSFNDGSIGPGLARRQSSRIARGNDVNKPLDTSLSVLFGGSANANRASPMMKTIHKPLPEVKINVAPQFMQGAALGSTSAMAGPPNAAMMYK